MKIKRHGLMLGFERVGSKVFLSVKPIGKLTHADYEKIRPFVDSALAGLEDPLVNVFVDGSELDGWELRVVWDDFRFGLSHGGKFNKVALYSESTWQHFATKVAAWFSSGEVKHFSSSAEALRWLHE